MMEVKRNFLPADLLGRSWFWPVLVAGIIGLVFTFGLSRMNYNRAPRAPMAVSGGLFAAKSLAGTDGRLLEQASLPPAASTAAPLERKVISTASLTLRVKSAGKAAETLAAMAASWGGFVESSQIGGEKSGRNTACVILRIPAARFTDFLGQAQTATAAKLLEKSIQGQDVTKDYVDYEARLRVWQKEEQQFQAILAKAHTVGEVLAVQAELGRVREQIEQIQGQLKYYDYNVALATATVNLMEGNKPAAAPWFLEQLGSLGRALLSSILSLVTVLLVLSPWAAAAWLIQTLYRRHASARQAKKSA